MINQVRGGPRAGKRHGAGVAVNRARLFATRDRDSGGTWSPRPPSLTVLSLFLTMPLPGRPHTPCSVLEFVINGLPFPWPRGNYTCTFTLLAKGRATQEASMSIASYGMGSQVHFPSGAYASLMSVFPVQQPQHICRCVVVFADGPIRPIRTKTLPGQSPPFPARALRFGARTIWSDCYLFWRLCLSCA